MDEVTLDQRVHSRHNQPESPRSYTLRAAHCPGCDLFLGVHVVSISDPVGHARLGSGRSTGREVDCGSTDEDWLAYQHALQATYQLTAQLQREWRHLGEARLGEARLGSAAACLFPETQFGYIALLIFSYTASYT
jgi:hypothetical protein